ncbi:unnamed protein product [Sphagnum balticum]
MARYKSAYLDRVKKQQEHEQRNLDEEQRVIREKDKLLGDHRARAQTLHNLQARIQAYDAANRLLEGIYPRAATQLFYANAYPDPLSAFLRTTYLD